MIDLLDETLRDLIIQRGMFDPDSVEVSFDQPTGTWAAGLTRPTINCYLYDIRENTELRSAEWIVEQNEKGQASKRLAPRRFNLSYLITAWTQNQAEDEHAILWRVLAVLSSHPIIPPEICRGELKHQPYPIKTETAQPALAIENLPDLWSVMDTPLRPSINYVVTLAMDRAVAFTSPLVFTKRAFVRERQAPWREEIVQIAGIVTLEGHPVAGARVTLAEMGRTVTTDDFGRYRFGNVPHGRYHVQVRFGQAASESEIVVPNERYELPYYDLHL
ncbi:MAG: DUF4255 domain-containing protein [Chloroflexi bacterium]|nr:DUF4255 domain-containing protein [Chloroflexota bacterium]